jgi:hypothetical protein
MNALQMRVNGTVDAEPAHSNGAAERPFADPAPCHRARPHISPANGIVIALNIIAPPHWL